MTRRAARRLALRQQLRQQLLRVGVQNPKRKRKVEVNQAKCKPVKPESSVNHHLSEVIVQIIIISYHTQANPNRDPDPTIAKKKGKKVLCVMYVRTSVFDGTCVNCGEPKSVHTGRSDKSFDTSVLALLVVRARK